MLSESRHHRLRQTATLSTCIIGVITLVFGLVLPAHGQSPLGTLSCQKANGTPFAADVFAFDVLDVSPAPVQLGNSIYVGLSSFSTLASLGNSLTFDSCVLTSSTSSLTLTDVYFATRTATFVGAGTDSVQAGQYTQIDLQYVGAVQKLSPNLPAPSGPLGSLSCSGVAGSFSAPLYTVAAESLAGSIFFDVETSSSAYVALQSSAGSYSNCTVTVGGLSATWSGVEVFATVLVGTGPGVIAPAGQISVFIEFDAANQSISGSSASSGLSPATTFNCQNPTFAAPVYGFNLSTNGDGLEVVLDSAELPALLANVGTTYSSCTLGSGTNMATLSGLMITDASISSEVGGNAVLSYADALFDSITVHGVTLAGSFNKSAMAHRKVAGIKEVSGARERLKRMVVRQARLPLG